MALTSDYWWFYQKVESYEFLALFERATCVSPKTCFSARSEGLSFLFQKATYIYNLSKKKDSSWYLVLFGTQGLLKTHCLIAPAKFQRARRASDHPVRKDGQLPDIVVTCLIRGKVGSPTSLCTIFHYIHSIFWVVFAGPLFGAMIFNFFLSKSVGLREISSSLL